MTTIAVTAPSGRVGRHVVHDLVRAGVRPRALAHRPASVAAELWDHVDTVVVDLADPAELTDALAGVERLFVTVPSTLPADPLAEYDGFGRSLARAVTDSEVERVVLQSSVGAELRHGAGEIDGLGRVEELLDDTPCSVVHLRCGFFHSNLALQLDQVREGVVPVVLPTDAPMPWVAPVDVARVAASWLLREHWSGRHVVGVHGPVDLSWDEATAIVSEVTGRPLRAEQIPVDEMRSVLAGAGLGEAQVEAVIGMSTGMRDGFVPERPRDVTTTTPTSLASWVSDELWPLLT